MPRVIVFSGPACSGKTTLAVDVAKEIGAPHLAMDDTRVRLMPDSAHTRQDRAIAFRAMSWAAELLASCGSSVVLDAQYRHREDREDVARAVLRSGAEFYLVECRVTPESAAERFRSRDPGPRLDLTGPVVMRMAAEFPYSGLGLTVDTESETPGRSLERIREYLNGPPASAPRWAQSIA